MHETTSAGFRRSEPTDEGVLLALMREFCAAERLPFDPAERAALLRSLWAGSGAGQVWMITVGDVAAGYFVLGFGFSLEFHGRDAFLDELFVAPAWRGRGLGTRALAAAESACRAGGVRALHLEVDHENDGARALYQRSGYRAYPRHLMTKRVR